MGSKTVTLSEAKIFLADFGESFSPLQKSRCDSHAPLLVRPPETIHEPSRPLTYSSDIWMLACSIREIIGQRTLFEPWFPTEDSITREQVYVCGILPPEWWAKWETRHNWFAEDGSPISEPYLPPLEGHFDKCVQAPRRKEGMPTFDTEEKDAVLAMLRSMLSYESEARPTAEQLLKSEWMQNWALPTYEKIRE
ncbi:Uu.00g038810.m01.CDS01 [Anthostomella pinea]|uniref:Uu.00g038810.m01.CDS01 n=1 Tax=Anthostomella pinea TaxID=933095 RepID=A0AAI8VA03_9PEZI|nr:Uu.00g038810.m01.CDS01 [Anthostomella pinea]